MFYNENITLNGNTLVPESEIVALTGNSYVDGILCGRRWVSHDLTLSFPDTSVTYTDYTDQSLISTFQPILTKQKQAFLNAVNELETICNIDLTQITESSTSKANIRVACSPNTVAGMSYNPDGTPEAGDVWFNPTRSTMIDPVPGGYGFFIMMHELGHSVGLKHAHEGTAVPSDHEHVSYTVMSYRSYENAPTGGYTNMTWGYPRTYMLEDIAALQYLYGAKMDKVGQELVYKWKPETETFSINGVDQPGNENDYVTFMCVWARGANLTYDFSSFYDNLHVETAPTKWTVLGQKNTARLGFAGSTTIYAPGSICNAKGQYVHKVIGGMGNDTIVGSDSVNQTFVPGRGNNVITGNTGTNTVEFAGRMSRYSWTNGASVISDLMFPEQTTTSGITWLKFNGNTFSTVPRNPPTNPWQVMCRVAQPNNGLNSIDNVRAAIDASRETSCVALMCYYFFTGSTVSEGGLDYLVSPAGGNPNNLNSTYYQSFNLENRYINFAVNLGKVGAGASWFSSNYGSLSLFESTRKAYTAIFGIVPDDYKVHQLIDSRVDYFASYGGDGSNGQGTKAAMVGWLLAEAIKAKLGPYAIGALSVLLDMNVNTNILPANLANYALGN